MLSSYDRNHTLTFGILTEEEGTKYMYAVTIEVSNPYESRMDWMLDKAIEKLMHRRRGITRSCIIEAKLCCII